MAEEASRSTNSASTIKSRSIARRNSLPLFRSDLGKDVPGYLRTSTGSCHDHCKHGWREMAEVKAYRPAIKRPVAARELKASDKPQLGQNDPPKIRKPQTSPSNKTPEASSKQNNPRDKDAITKSLEGFPKSVKPKLSNEMSMTRKSAATSGDEKVKREKQIVPGSGNLRVARTTSKINEGGNPTKSAKGPSTNAAVKLNAKAKPSPATAPIKVVAIVKPPVIKARPQSSPTKLKPSGLRGKSSSSPIKLRPARLRVNASSSPTKSRHVSLMVNSSSSPIKRKPACLKVNSLSSSTSFKLNHGTAKTPPRSISPRSVPSKKSIIIRSPIVKTGKSSKVCASEVVPTRRGSVSPYFQDAAKSEKKELQKENLVEAQIDEKNELQEENLVEAQIDEKKESQEENLVEAQIDERNELLQEDLVEAQIDEKKELLQEDVVEDQIDEKKELLQEDVVEDQIDENKELLQEDVVDDHIDEKKELLQEDVVEDQIDEKNELLQEDVVEDQIDEKKESQEENLADDHIDEKKELLQEDVVEDQIDEEKELLQENLVEDQIDEKKEEYENDKEDLSHETKHQNQEVIEYKDCEASEKTLYIIETNSGNSTEPAPNAEDEIPDMHPLASVSPPQSPRELEASINDLTNKDTAVPCADQETPDIEPLSSLSPEILHESQSSIVVSNEASIYEASLDGSIYTDSEVGYSSSEDEHLVEGENPKGDVDNIKLKKKSLIVASQENGKDPVKLRFRRGRVIDIADENHGPRRLKFRRARVLDEKAVNDLIRKRSFKVTDATQVDETTENNSGSVVLRHQDMQDKKDAQVLLNNVIEKTASELVEKRKSMVKALVGAFETVISLQDGKPATTQEDQ